MNNKQVRSPFADSTFSDYSAIPVFDEIQNITGKLKGKWSSNRL